MLVLIVDDSKAMRLLVKRALRQAGYNVSVAEAANGAEAIDKVRELNPDLVLSDWYMPEMDGLGLLEYLKKEGTCPKFGFITSEPGPEMRRRALDMGASFFISKPFTAEAFEQSLDELLK